MKSLLFFILFAPALLCSQETPCLTLFDKSRDCCQSLLGKLVSRDTDFVWDNLHRKNVESETRIFKYFEEHLEEQTSTPGLLSKHKTVFLAGTKGLKKINENQKYIEIYEITFGSSAQAEAVISKITAAKIQAIYWPDGPFPVRFYKTGKSLFVFSNDSDDSYEPWAEQWFNPIVEKLILKLEAL